MDKPLEHGDPYNSPGRNSEWEVWKCPSHDPRVFVREYLNTLSLGDSVGRNARRGNGREGGEGIMSRDRSGGESIMGHGEVGEGKMRYIIVENSNHTLHSPQTDQCLSLLIVSEIQIIETRKMS